MSQNPYEPPQHPYHPPQMPPGQAPMQDLEHLKLLSIFHYVVAGLTAMFACFPIIHFIVGLVILFAPPTSPPGQGPPPGFTAMFGLMFTIIPGILIIMGWSMAVCVFLAGRSLALQTRYMFCLIVACVECMFMPFGTVLGVFTIIVLMRPTVKALFDMGQNPFRN